MARGPSAQASRGGGGSVYYEIANFQLGMDTRKEVMTAPAGTLRMLQNAHITPGGEIEKRSAFNYWCNAPPGALGMCALNEQPYVFLNDGHGLGVQAPTPTSVGVIHIDNPASGSGVINQFYCYDIFDGKIFAVFGATDGNVHGYYDGVEVPGAMNRVGKVRTYKEKMYGVIGRFLNFSAVGDPTTWVDPPPDASGNVAHNGSGFIDLGAHDGDSENISTMEVYYDKMAIFTTYSCQLWFLDPDPSLNQYYQTIRDAGTLAPNSVRQYVANDVYFLGTHGLRSLRARDLTTTAAVADIGSPIDPIIQELIANTSPLTLWQTQALLSARTGRIWFVMPDRIYVLSNWASPNISAWSVYIPEFTIAAQGACFADPYVVMMDTNDRVYRFGSSGPLTYDSCPVSVVTPALSFDKPATFKFYQGFDAIVSADPGAWWNVEMSFDPSQNPTPWDQICEIDSPTMMGGRIPVNGRGTHVQLQLTHQSPGPATLSKLFIHYALAETD